MSNNQLCGIDRRGNGTYTTEGIVAIVEMLKVNTTLQSIRCVCSLFDRRQQPLTHPFTLARSLRYNQLGTEGWCAIFAALRDNKDNKSEAGDLTEQSINAEIAKVLAEYVSVSTVITSLK